MLALLWFPQVDALRHDDPCGSVGDASDLFGGAKKVSPAGMGAGCTTESIAPGNSCGVTPDSSDWFFADTPATNPLAKIKVTLTFLFAFCGSSTIDSNLEIYFVPAGSLLEPASTPSMDGNGPGFKICTSANAGTTTEQVTCSWQPAGAGSAAGRWYIHKIRAAGSGANRLQVAFV